MKCLVKAGLATVILTSPLIEAHPEDDPLLSKVLLDRFEWQPGDEQTTTWDAHAWLGKDLHKLWLKTEGEINEDHTEEARAQLLYGRAIAPYWDLQVGWRRDFRPGPEQDWLAVGLHGLAPYFFETEVGLFIDDDGRSALSLETERELMLTQKWVIAPEVELQAYGQNDRARGLGSGLATLEASVRLSYEIRREIAPYIGIGWHKALGNTADFRRQEGERTQETQWVVGVRAWFQLQLKEVKRGRVALPRSENGAATMEEERRHDSSSLPCETAKAQLLRQILGSRWWASSIGGS